MSVDETNETKSEKPSESLADESAVCEVCGKFDAHQFGEQFFCVDCAQAAGSCCAGEFQKDGE